MEDLMTARRTSEASQESARCEANVERQHEVATQHEQVPLALQQLPCRGVE